MRKLNERVYAVNTSPFLNITVGAIQSIQTKTWTHFKYYARSGEIEVTTVSQYSLYESSEWFYADRVFSTREEAEKFLRGRLEQESDKISDQINGLARQIDIAEQVGKVFAPIT